MMPSANQSGLRATVLFILIVAPHQGLATGTPGTCNSLADEHGSTVTALLFNIDNLRSIDYYSTRVKKLAVKFGPLHPALYSDTLGLGLAYRQTHRDKDAATTLRHAMQIIRVNEGLYNPKQLPLLDVLIEIGKQIGTWSDVADDYDHMLWILEKNYADNDPRQFHDLRRIRRWHIDAYSKPTGRSLRQHFAAVARLDRRLQAISRACGRRDGNPEQQRY